METKSIYQKFMKKLLFIDIFGEEPILYVNNHSEFRTKYGSFLTMILVLIGLTASWEFGQELLFR